MNAMNVHHLLVAEAEVSNHQMADHPQQWDDHCGDIRYFISSFKHYQGDFETLFRISQGHDRYYLVLSESEYQSWQTYGWIRSPRLSNELASPQDQVFHAIHMFNRIGDAINHLYYLRVAHGFMFNCHSESGHGRYYIYSGALRGKVEDIPEVSEESRARILRIVIDQDSMAYTDLVKYKVKLRQFFTFHQIWSADTAMFSIYQTASSFMTQHALNHESVASSNWYLSETILEIIQHPQVRLTERVIKIIRGSHPHMEALLISDGEFRQSITELEIDRSFTVVRWNSMSHLHHQWRSMTQASGSVERGTQGQLLVQQSSPSVPADTHSGEFMSSQRTWFGHSQHLQFSASSTECSLVSCHHHSHRLLSMVSSATQRSTHEARSWGETPQRERVKCQPQ